MYICCAYSAALMEDIRYQPSTTRNGTLFFAYGTFWHSIMSLSFIVIPICIYVPYPTLLLLILSPQDGILVCGRKKAILDSYTSDSLWLRMWWHKIGIRGFVSPFFLLPLFLFWMRLLTPSYLSSSLLLEVHGITLFVALSYFQQGPARFNFFHVFHYI